MKQHITIDQLNELSEQSKEKLREWWKPGQGDLITVKGMTISTDLPGINGKYGKEYGWSTSVESGTEKALPLLSIGQMIEFIRDNDKKHLWTWYFFYGPNADTLDVCDILWESCKEVLNDEDGYQKLMRETPEPIGISRNALEKN